MWAWPAAGPDGRSSASTLRLYRRGCGWPALSCLCRGIEACCGVISTGLPLPAFLCLAALHVILGTSGLRMVPCAWVGLGAPRDASGVTSRPRGGPCCVVLQGPRSTLVCFLAGAPTCAQTRWLCRPWFCKTNIVCFPSSVCMTICCGNLLSRNCCGNMLSRGVSGRLAYCCGSADTVCSWGFGGTCGGASKRACWLSLTLRRLASCVPGRW